MGRYSDKVMSRLPSEMKGARFALEISRIFREETIRERSRSMGYRSTVAYTIRFTPLISIDAESDRLITDSPTDEELKECKASFYTFLAEAKVKYLGALSDDGTVVDESNMAINFLAYDVKWYETYEDVKVHEGLMELGQSWETMGNKNIGGIFMRIGEELDDMVQEAWGEHDWEWLRIHREIICDWEESR
jgi:hypothetical protein